jgi:putative salt-induced outer membrane protein YdiY
MKLSRNLLAGLALAATLVPASQLSADTVGTKDGSTIQGKVLRVTGGVVEIETAFAGVLKINQASVASLSTDAPVFLRYQGGNTIQGAVSTAAGGEVRVAGPGAWGTGKVDAVEAVWTDPADSPESKAAAAARRKWAFEASVDVVGNSGNTNSLSTAAGFAATLAGPEDKLQFYAAYTRATQEVTTGTPPVKQDKTSADNAKAGVDYSAFFTQRLSWYAREEIGTDKIKDLDFYSNTAAGLGYALIREPKHELTFRTGLAYRYESYEYGEDISTPALDLGLIHSYTAKNWRIGNKLTFMPSLEDFANYRIQHDSFFEVPLSSTQWKVRLGIANDYVSEPQPGKKKLDTTYYTKFLLSWK